jgi:serine phosphatase RsbU (regulator of sigma subunit)
MIRPLYLWAILIILSTHLYGQNKIVLSDSTLNTSIANRFDLYLIKDASIQVDLNNFSQIFEVTEKRALKMPVENIDFTTDIYWLFFEVYNDFNATQDLLIELARPITNTIELYEIRNNKAKLVAVSGDALDYDQKTIDSYKSLLPIYLNGKEKKYYAIKLSSDGETISLPIIFWKKDVLAKKTQTYNFFVGIFYGVFLFVIVIYLTFYFLLKDNSFLLYTVYVLFSALLQFGLDGFIHQYFFTSGGYFTQHSILFVAGCTVFFVVLYGRNYLKLKEYFPKLNKVLTGFAYGVAIVVGLSLIPGYTYELSYPIINGISFLATLGLVITAIYIKVKGNEVSYLFIFGMVFLIAGAVVFILGNFGIINMPTLTQNSLKIGTLIEIVCLSILMAFKYRSLQQEKELAQLQLLSELESKNALMLNINEKLEIQVKERTKEIEKAKHEIELKNTDIISSIKYAERIQRSVLPSDEKFKKLLPNSFVLYKPRDIVSGDFYWIEQLTTSDTNRKLIAYATADCTGHGVPGAFVSILGHTYLKLSKTEKSVNSTGEALDFINKGFNETFSLDFDGIKVKDGMDLALCSLDLENKKLYFSGAKNPVYIVRQEELFVIKGDTMPIGFPLDEMKNNFTTQTFDIAEGDMIYTFSDGYADQFGGPNGKKFMYKQFKEVLISIAQLPVDEQKIKLSETFNNWINYRDENGATFEYEQIDDVLIIGVKI